MDASNVTASGGGDDGLPNDWQKLTAPDSGEVYYYSEVRGVSQWTPPSILV